MLIQNTSNLATVAMPVKLPGNGGPVAVAAHSGASAEAVKPEAVKSAVAQQPTNAQLANEVNKINVALQQTNKSLELSFSVDKTTNKQVIKLMDKTTGDTIVQIPSEAVLAIAQGIDEFQQGLLLKQKA
ncbi:MAG: flagellar protein FlaG [Gammaproteobacteria bacterium]|nr:flagellar protein FlaG [Gammaproteobacteria bacterium]MBU1480848.1 flagellar protein FlaG [Gammaproteobacteria bacterium]